MAQAIRCDRCRKFEIPDEWAPHFVVSRKMGAGMHLVDGHVEDEPCYHKLDLCRECQEAGLHWLSQGSE